MYGDKRNTMLYIIPKKSLLKFGKYRGDEKLKTVTGSFRM